MKKVSDIDSVIIRNERNLSFFCQFYCIMQKVELKSVVDDNKSN